MLLFINSVNGFALLTDWANFVCLSSPSFDSVKNHFFDFFPPDFLLPEDLEAADFLDAEPLDFLAEDLPPPFFDF